MTFALFHSATENRWVMGSNLNKVKTPFTMYNYLIAPPRCRAILLIIIAGAAVWWHVPSTPTLTATHSGGHVCVHMDAPVELGLAISNFVLQFIMYVSERKWNKGLIKFDGCDRGFWYRFFFLWLIDVFFVTAIRCMFSEVFF